MAGQDALARITIHQAASDLAEAEFVVQTVDRLLGGASLLSLDSGRADGGAEHGLSFADVAVLYRTDAQSGPLAEALDRAGMLFQKRSHDRLGDRPAVRALVRALRDPAAPGPPPGDRSLAARPAAAAAAEAPGRDRRRGRGARPARPWPSAAGTTWTGSWPSWPLATRSTPGTRGGLGIAAHPPRRQGLRVPVVFLVGCEDGSLPALRPPLSQEETAEERRLFFVGMTRARSHLFLSHARKRAWRGSVREAEPSPFLADLEPPRSTTPAPAPAAAPSRRPATSRRLSGRERPACVTGSA